IWIIYPGIKKAFLHYHLDKYAITSKKAVQKGTLVGYTGKTGYATGIHLHLGIRDLSRLSASQIKNMTWASLRTCAYIDPEVYSARYSINPYKLPTRVLKKGNTGADVKWVQWELSGMGYNIGADGVDGHLGPITTEAIKQFQRQHKDLNGKQLIDDGFAGPLTVAAIKNA
ncbi:MAG: peptidoglycan-binding protein, partial [Oscillospiraceae bacterium]